MALPDTRVKLFDEQVQALNPLGGSPLVGLAYFAKLPSGEVVFGETDEDGKIPRIASGDPEAIEIHWGLEALIRIQKFNGGEC
jgi:type VI secretion system secreted protein VgrG